MRRRPVLLGIVLGLVLAGGLIGFRCASGAGRSVAEPNGELLSECDGALRELVIHYASGAARLVGKPYGDFLRQLPIGVTVHVICPEQTDFEDLTQRVGTTACTLRPVIVHHPLTPWSRDRWLALAPVVGERHTTLLLPREENAAVVWPGRAGDQQAGPDLAEDLHRTTRAWRSPWFFDAGDFLCDGQTVFAIPAVLRKNLHLTVRDQETLQHELDARFRRRVVFLDASPDHHAGMFMMAVGEGRMLVGNSRLAQAILSQTETSNRTPCCPCGDDFSEETQSLLDKVAAQLEREGYAVTRIPIVPGTDGKTFLTYVNVIMDQRDGQRVVYLPQYQGQDALNREAVRVWRALGYEVRPVDGTTLYPNFGTLHCVVNVLKRG
jgi:hypothetical protein